jgi:hypothetical protein
MNDSYGDGICCGEGNGDFNVLDESGTVVLDGNGAFTSTTSSTFCVEATGVREDATAAFTVHPVPCDGRFTLERATSQGAATLSVRDTAGRLVHSQRLIGQATTVDLGPVDAGIYNLELLEGGKRTVRRISVVR